MGSVWKLLEDINMVRHSKFENQELENQGILNDSEMIT